MKLFTFRECEVRLNLSFALLLLGSALSGMAFVFWAGFICVLFHELFHALMAKRLGYWVSSLTIYPFGGVAVIEGLAQAAPRDEGLIALAGPLFNLLVCMSLYTLGYFLSEMPLSLTLFADVNLALALFNLLPALPLDGGRILRSLLADKLGAVKATRAAAVPGIPFALMLLGVGIWGLTQGKINLTVLSAGSYLLFACCREIYFSGEAFLRSTPSAGKKGVLPVRQLAVAPQTRLYSVLERMVPGSYHLISVIDSEGLPLGTLSEEELRAFALRRGSYATFREALRETH